MWCVWLCVCVISLVRVVRTDLLLSLWLVRIDPCFYAMCCSANIVQTNKLFKPGICVCSFELVVMASSDEPRQVSILGWVRFRRFDGMYAGVDPRDVQARRQGLRRDPAPYATAAAAAAEARHHSASGGGDVGGRGAASGGGDDGGAESGRRTRARRDAPAAGTPDDASVGGSASVRFTVHVAGSVIHAPQAQSNVVIHMHAGSATNIHIRPGL